MNIKNIIDEVQNENYDYVKLTWEMIKMRRRGFSIQLSLAKRKAAEKELS